MNAEILKRKYILDLEVKDLLKVMNIIDGKEVNIDSDIASLNEKEFLELETKLISEIKTRLEDIFKN